jgi:MoxR-like ATPase
MAVQPSRISNADIIYYISALMVHGGFNIMLLGPAGVGKTRAVTGLEAFLNEAYPNNDKTLAKRVFSLNASHALDSAAVNGVTWGPDGASFSLDELSQNITRTHEKHARGKIVIDPTILALYTQDRAHSKHLEAIRRKAQPGHDTVILLLDEFLTAPYHVQRAILSLVSHRTILNYTIQNPLTIVATGNPPSETNVLSSVLAVPAHRRFLVFTLSHTTPD